MGLMMFTAARERRRDRIKAAFGQIPPDPRYMEEVRIYYEQTRDMLPGETIDDITWNDLEMDQVFARINHTGSYIGEQVLYRRLRAGTEEAAADQAWEERLRLLREDVETRTDLETALARIGKAKEDYHLPLFLRHAGELGVGPVWLYRSMQCLLAAALVGGIFLRQEWCLLAALFVALVNVCIYSAGKVRCEAYLSALGSIREMAVFGQFLIKKDGGGGSQSAVGDPTDWPFPASQIWRHDRRYDGNCERLPHGRDTLGFYRISLADQTD